MGKQLATQSFREKVVPRYFRKTNRRQTKMSGPWPPRTRQGRRETWRRQSRETSEFAEQKDAGKEGDEALCFWIPRGGDFRQIWADLAKSTFHPPSQFSGLEIRPGP